MPGRSPGNPVRGWVAALRAADQAGLVAGAASCSIGGPTLRRGATASRSGFGQGAGEGLDRRLRQGPHRSVSARVFGPASLYAADLVARLERHPVDGLAVDHFVFGALAAAEQTGLPTAGLWHTVGCLEPGPPAPERCTSKHASQGPARCPRAVPAGGASAGPVHQRLRLRDRTHRAAVECRPRGSVAGPHRPRGRLRSA